MTKVLITGMSGTGKSTVMRILWDRGYHAVNTDEPGWCVPEGGDWTRPDSEWIWDESRITRLLEAPEFDHLFVVGCRANQGRLYHRFDHIVVLTAPIEVMLQRISTRTNNMYGRSEAERERITQAKLEFETLLIRGAAVKNCGFHLSRSVTNRLSKYRFQFVTKLPPLLRQTAPPHRLEG